MSEDLAYQLVKQASVLYRLPLAKEYHSTMVDVATTMIKASQYIEEAEQLKKLRASTYEPAKNLRDPDEDYVPHG